MAIKKITCCVDFSENAETACKTAVEMATKFGARLYIVHVLPPVVNPLLVDSEWVLPPVEPKKALIIRVEEKLQEMYGSKIEKGIKAELIVLDGHVSSEILKFVEEKQIDLVIMGAYGASGMGLVIFGSVAKRVAHKAPCSVMIVRDRP